MNHLFIYCDIATPLSQRVELERFIISLGTPLGREDHFWIIETENSAQEYAKLFHHGSPVWDIGCL